MGVCCDQTIERGGIFSHSLSYQWDQRRYTHMAQVKVYYDASGNTLTVWFGNPEDEDEVEETGEEVLLMKDKQGRVIGFEKLNFLPGQATPLRVAFETITA